MRADNTQFIVDAAKRRRADALSRAHTALTKALQAGEPITVSQLAATANVSRSWLYSEPTIRDQLAKVAAPARGHRRPPATPGPNRASEASLRTRLDVAVERVRRLEVENRNLRDQLARALGDQRSSRVTGGRP